MNDADYQSTLECLRIAVRLITPLDLDGFLARVERLEPGAGEDRMLDGMRSLIRLARALKPTRSDTAGPIGPASGEAMRPRP